MLQDLKNKAGEVKFRAKLFQQQVEGTATLDGELNSTEMLNEMRRRMEITRRDFAEIAQSGVLQSPFLELGAERCQRSLVLANDFGLNGYAADLSFESLRYGDFLAQQENCPKCHSEFVAMHTSCHLQMILSDSRSATRLCITSPIPHQSLESSTAFCVREQYCMWMKNQFGGPGN
jgi:hypothetical protein